jgi:two-component system nitrogen regulation response regulator NtrX
MGASGYLEKPVPLQKLLSTVGRALRGGQVNQRTALPLASLGKGPVITDLKKRLEQVVSLRAPLLLSSEPGTGVEVCARFLHRPNTPWVEPDTLTALANAPFDLLEQAKGGLLFLKEIGDLNRLAQKGLLLLLGKLEKYNVRLVCVTSTPLAELAAQGAYDPKLYETLSGLNISVPALREHREDIPELAAQILSRYIESGEAPLRQFSTAALNCLRNHDWPGNLAQLTGAVHSLALTCASDEISADDVKQILASSSPPQAVGGIPLNVPLREARDMFEKTYFEQLIDQENGNMTKVAERAGLERTHLYRKLKLLGIKLRNH